MIRQSRYTKPQDPGNIIEKQADKFIANLMGHRVDSVLNIKDSISEIRSELLEYNNYSHRATFLERIRYRIKLGWEDHNAICPHKANSKVCHKDEIFENILFFVQNE